MTKTTGNFTDFVSFSRASGGTALRRISYGNELVTNGTFDTGISGWSSPRSNSTLSFASGRLRTTAAASGSFGAAYAIAGLTVGKVYTTSFSIPAYTTTGVPPRIYRVDSNNTLLATGPVQLEQDSGSAVFVATATTMYVGVIGVAGSAGQYVELDNISVKEVLFDRADGTLQLFNHPTNVPRVEYDASGNRKGLLIEEARTNLVPYSQDFTGTGWGVAVGGTGTYTMTPNYAVSPDGTMTATRIQASLNGGTTTSDFVMLSRTITPAVQNTSTYVKSLSGSPTLNISGFSAVSNTMTVSTEWDRVSLTDTAGTSNQIRTFLLRGGQTPVHTNTVDVLIWGAQLEVGAFPTSYIPTSGATATRAADICSIATSAFGYNQKAGTIVVDVSDTQFGTSGYPRAVEIGNSSNQGERINIFVVAASGTYSFGFYTANVQQMGGILVTSISNPFSPSKAALAYRTNDGAAAYGGVIKNTDTSIDVTGTTYPRNTLKIGGAANYSADQINGHIKSIAYYPRRLTNAQIQALTA